MTADLEPWARLLRLMGHTASFIHAATGINGADRWPVDLGEWRRWRTQNAAEAWRIKSLVQATFGHRDRPNRVAYRRRAA